MWGVRRWDLSGGNSSEGREGKVRSTKRYGAMMSRPAAPWTAWLRQAAGKNAVCMYARLFVCVCVACVCVDTDMLCSKKREE